MASMVDAREDSLIEGFRTSLLDLIEDKNRSMNKKSLLHRMVIISKMCHSSFVETGQYYEKFFKDVQNQYQCEGVTGLLLLYPRHSVHVIESSAEVMIELAKDLESMSQSPDRNERHMAKSKILVVSNDIPHRLYQHWSYRVLDIEAPRLDEHDSNEPADRLVVDMLTQLLKLGNYLARQPKVSLKNAMDSLHDKVPELLPQQAVIGYLLENELHTQCITTPEVYLEQHQRPYDVVLDSELVWPMPVKLFPYN